MSRNSSASLMLMLRLFKKKKAMGCLGLGMISQLLCSTPRKHEPFCLACSTCPVRHLNHFVFGASDILYSTAQSTPSMSVNRKKAKHYKQRLQKSNAAEGEGAELVNEDCPRDKDKDKDIDSHPLECGHSVVVMYRDSSHRLAKVGRTSMSMHVFNGADSPVILDIGADLQECGRQLDVLHPLLRF